MTQIHDFELDVRRHSDGSIDFDHYRSRAAALRGAALRDASTLRSAFKLVMALAGFDHRRCRGRECTRSRH
jgi:hypothetical protein